MIRIEPIENVEQQAMQKKNQNLQKLFAKKVAMNLYNYMSSFERQTGTLQNGNTQEYFLVPTNIFDKWYDRFEQKFDKDPNFFSKVQEN